MQFKTISFDLHRLYEDKSIPAFTRIRDKILRGDYANPQELRWSGLAIATPLINKRLTERTMLEILNIIIPAGVEFEPEMVTIPAGRFTMGSLDFENSQPLREITLSGFRMGRYSITYEEYFEYIEDTGGKFKNGPLFLTLEQHVNCYKHPEDLSPEGRRERLLRHPVEHVNWSDAVKYCEWLSEKTGRRFRLPTEAEWEYAAGGAKSLKYPWGNEFDGTKAAYLTNDETRPVDHYPNGVSPFGIMGMAGNVWEWCADWYTATYDTKNVYIHETLNVKYRVARGGSSLYDKSEYLRCAYRNKIMPESAVMTVGFRIAEEL